MMFIVGVVALSVVIAYLIKSHEKHVFLHDQIDSKVTHKKALVVVFALTVVSAYAIKSQAKELFLT